MLAASACQQYYLQEEVSTAVSKLVQREHVVKSKSPLAQFDESTIGRRSSSEPYSDLQIKMIQWLNLSNNSRDIGVWQLSLITRLSAEGLAHCASGGAVVPCSRHAALVAFLQSCFYWSRLPSRSHALSPFYFFCIMDYSNFANSEHLLCGQMTSIVRQSGVYARIKFRLLVIGDLTSCYPGTNWMPRSPIRSCLILPCITFALCQHAYIVASAIGL